MPHVEDYDKKVELIEEGEGLFVESCVNGTPSPVLPPDERGRPTAPVATPGS